ncbi:MAG: hypothetical protein EBU97_02180, partial [Rhodobacteraceae bacterium]|nr:hypothetical protein [Paracoccaceae bacterium]
MAKSGRKTQAGRGFLGLCAALGLVALAGCTGDVATGGYAPAGDLSTGILPASGAWVARDRARLVVQTMSRTGAQQRISLPNDGLIAGDNFILARATSGGILGPARLSDSAFSDIPATELYPFAGMTTVDQRAINDDYGPVIWIEQKLSSSVKCVLAMRALGPLMGHSLSVNGGMALLLRNCGTGTTETLLSPILAASITGMPGRTATT